jgi:hypothetical protein
MDDGAAVHEVRLTLHAERAPVRVSLEPTAMEYRLAPGDSIGVLISGPGTGIVDVSHVQDMIVVWPWAGGEVRAFVADGSELDV